MARFTPTAISTRRAARNRTPRDAVPVVVTQVVAAEHDGLKTRKDSPCVSQTAYVQPTRPKFRDQLGSLVEHRGGSSDDERPEIGRAHV